MSESPLGVVVLCYRSTDVIESCLDSLIASEGIRPEIVLCDNASPDETVPTIRSWAQRNGVELAEVYVDADLDDVPESYPRGITLVRSARNRGFAGGVNLGLRVLLARPEIDLFWVLNPDTVVTPDAGAAYARTASAAGPFALMGGRTLYREPPGLVQSDGGRVNRWTGVCSNANQGMKRTDPATPQPRSVDFISGANMVASRTFVETVGLMREDYFLYYEEVDWAFRRGDLPLLLCPESIVEHHGGTTIGTGSVNRRAFRLRELLQLPQPDEIRCPIHVALAAHLLYLQHAQGHAAASARRPRRSPRGLAGASPAVAASGPEPGCAVGIPARAPPPGATS